VRYSALSTIKYKHKLKSKKMVIEQYGVDLEMVNFGGNFIKLISVKEILEMKPEYLVNFDRY
jgi:hypothetical protein